MVEFKNRVAVITGAASGIGRALVYRCIREGMKVVLADVNASAVSALATTLQATGAAVLPVPTDVSNAHEVQALAAQTLDTFGTVDVLCNNAGVVSVPVIWECPLDEWKWILDINLWGVIHGMHFFIPHMLKQPNGGHIVNTASTAGLASEPGLGPYRVAKHGVVALSETLHHELTQRGSSIRVSVLCPGPINTSLMDTSAQTRPTPLPDTPEARADEAGLRAALREGISPDDVAESVFTGLKTEAFYILPSPNSKRFVQLRLEDILYDRKPTNPEA